MVLIDAKTGKKTEKIINANQSFETATTEENCEDEDVQDFYDDEGDYESEDEQKELEKTEKQPKKLAPKKEKQPKTNDHPFIQQNNLSENLISLALNLLSSQDSFWKMDNSTLSMLGLTKSKCFKHLKKLFPFFPSLPLELSLVFEDLLITSLIIVFVQNSYNEDQWNLLNKFGVYISKWFDVVDRLDSHLSFLKEEYPNYSYCFDFDSFWVPYSKNLLKEYSKIKF